MRSCSIKNRRDISVACENEDRVRHDFGSISDVGPYSEVKRKMRDPIENITILQKQLNELQLENQLLKNILDRSGISYVQELKHLKEPEGTENFDPNQGARIRHPREITEKNGEGVPYLFLGAPRCLCKTFGKEIRRSRLLSTV